MLKMKKLVDTAREALAVAIRTINDGTNPRATGFDHLSRAQISACQVSHVQKALSALDQISFESAPVVTRATDDAHIQSILMTNKALALLLKQNPDDPAAKALALEHDMRVQQLLMGDPYALKTVKPEAAAFGELFPAPCPYQGFIPCKVCHSRVMLVMPMHYVQCSHCDASTNTPSEWNALNCTNDTPTRLTEVPQ